MSCHEKVTATCHAERSEASGVTNRAAWPTRMLRCAQHDMSKGLCHGNAVKKTL